MCTRYSVNVNPARTVSINDLLPGEIAEILSFSPELTLQSRLVELGLLPGVIIRKVKTAPFSGPVQIKVRDYYLSIRYKDAGKISVIAI